MFHHTTVIVQKIQISAINGTMFLIQKTWIQLTAKPNFELKLRQTFVALSEVRVSVEWLFGDIINFFRFLDYKKNLKIGLSSVGKMYLVFDLLRNAITCLYGNQTSEFFDLETPTLEEYSSNRLKSKLNKHWKKLFFKVCILLNIGLPN